MNHAYIKVRNDSGYKALIQLYHASLCSDTTRGTRGIQVVSEESGGYMVEKGASTEALSAGYKWGPGDFSDLDQWMVVLTIFDDASHGVWSGMAKQQLRHSDSQKTYTFAVSKSHFSVNMGSRSTTVSMAKHEDVKRPRVSHVFVLMLENHSFDNVFAKSGIKGITVAGDGNTNTYGGVTYPVTGGAPTSMPTDPGHEFADVVEQLSGNKNNHSSGDPYPAIDSSGFASNYATTTTEGPTPQSADIGKIMACFDTQSELPVIYQLATEFAICDHWYSSLPGPTWPNRYFLHGASSNGLEHTPTSSMAVDTESKDGFVLPCGTIFERLSSKGLTWRIFNDDKGSSLGQVPQVTSLKHLVWGADTQPVRLLPRALRSPYPAVYTFIEPNYGDLRGETYRGGSSQHPMDSMAGGERLIKYVYETIRNSPLWYSSMLIITYDEHGGYYDSVRPPGAHYPYDGSMTSPYNESGFRFEQYGVRVPAVVVSPWISKGTVSTTVYDHTSVLKTLEKAFDLQHLTQRDDKANDLLGLAYATGVTAPRTDCPTTLATPAPVAEAPPLTPEEDAALDRQPLPESGNIWGFIAIALKTEIEISAETEADEAQMIANVKQLQTYGDARVFIERIAGLVGKG